MLKISASLYESSGVTRTLCSFRLLLEGKAGKEIPESLSLVFLEKVFSEQFSLSDTEDITSVSLNRPGIAALHQRS